MGAVNKPVLKLLNRLIRQALEKKNIINEFTIYFRWLKWTQYANNSEQKSD